MPYPVDQPVDPSADLLEGGPVADDAPDSPEPDPEPQLVTIRVNGKNLTVTQDVADAILEREDQFNRKLSEQGAELGRLRQQTQPKPEPPPADNADDDLEFFQSPSKAFSRRTQTLREELKQELRTEYQLEQARAAWWAAFWKDNPTFAGKEKLVGAVLQQEFESIKDLPPDKARAALADAVNELIHGAQQQPGTRTSLPNRPARTERPSGSPLPTPAPPAEPQTYGLTDVIRQRRAARRKAAAG